MRDQPVSRCRPISYKHSPPNRRPRRCSSASAAKTATRSSTGSQPLNAQIRELGGFSNSSPCLHAEKRSTRRGARPTRVRTTRPDRSSTPYPHSADTVCVTSVMERTGIEPVTSGLQNLHFVMRQGRTASGWPRSFWFAEVQSGYSGTRFGTRHRKAQLLRLSGRLCGASADEIEATCPTGIPSRSLNGTRRHWPRCAADARQRGFARRPGGRSGTCRVDPLAAADVRAGVREARASDRDELPVV
jgi:hypothetical protein